MGRKTEKLRAVGKPAFRTAEGVQPPPPGTMSIAGTSRADRPLWNKILPPLVLAVIGVALLLGAIALYTSPSELPTPPYATLDLESTFPVMDIAYTVNQISPTIAEIEIEVDLPGKAPPVGAPTADLLSSIGDCFPDLSESQFTTTGVPTTAPYCLNVNPREAWVQPLIFRPNPKLGGFYGVAFADLFVKAHSFGVTFNGVTASAAMPQVIFQNSSGAAPSVYTTYNIPSASSYDWAAFPTVLVTGTSATWDENGASGGVLDGRAAVGTDHANEAKDNSKTFVAGALLALRGSSALVCRPGSTSCQRSALTCTAAMSGVPTSMQMQAGWTASRPRLLDANYRRVPARGLPVQPTASADACPGQP